MKIILAPDSFKGSLTQMQVIEGLEKAAKRHFPGCETLRFPIADGGEGTVEALLTAAGGEARYGKVKDSLGRDVTAKYGILRGDTAVVEMAAADGLTLFQEEERNLEEASSFGTGQLIKEVLEAGYRKLILAIGGSATNDGGMGAMTALGMEFLDGEGQVILPAGKNLERIAKIRTEGLHPALSEADLTIMCDVDNPLLGPGGATSVYGPQKGGTPEILKRLEAGMKNYADVLLETTGKAFHDMPGAGAAGGIAVPFLAFTGAKMRSGISVVLETMGFEESLADADLVVTGEGRLDHQSLCGKVLCGIGNLCKRHEVPVVALVGGIGDGGEAIYDLGVESVMVLVDQVMELSEAMEEAERLLESAADRMFRLIRLGRALASKRQKP